MLLSKTCEYAIRATLQVAVRVEDKGRKYIPVREIAEEVNLSFHFLAKIAQQLIEAGILNSLKGPNGGVGLARPAKSIHLIEIVEAIDGLKAFEGCLLGLPECSEENPCPLHKTWARSRQSVLDELKRESLDSIVRKNKKRQTG